MPARTVLHSLSSGILRRWPALERFALRALDVPYRITLAPFRRRSLPGEARETRTLIERAEAYNEAAERYFANFPDPDYLLNKPFSDTHHAGKHLIDAGILIEAMRLRPGDTVVEIGAGSCWLSHMLNRFGCRTIAVDVSPSALALGGQLFKRDPATNWELEPLFLSYDGHRLPIPDAAADAIVINDAFHHIPNQRELLTEMHRVLRPDGIVAMSEPGRGHAAAETSVAEASAGVLENELVLEDLAALARACGFKGATVVIASPHAHRQIPATELGAFMGGQGFASYWKGFCSGLEQHHYVLLYKGSTASTTKRPGRVLARIDAPGGMRAAPHAPATLDVRVTNIGDTRWIAAEGAGWTRLGAHLYRGGESRAVVDFDWIRVSLPHDVEPGAQVAVAITLPALEAGDYLVSLDLVVEGVLWFADAGSSPANVRLVIS